MRRKVIIGRASCLFCLTNLCGTKYRSLCAWCDVLATLMMLYAVAVVLLMVRHLGLRDLLTLVTR